MDIEINTAPPESGMEDIPKDKHQCGHPHHNPPGYMVIPRGKRYRHVCPGCHQITYVESPSPRY